MSKYKAVIFDFDNTLVDVNTFVSTFTKNFILENNIVSDWEKFFLDLNNGTIDLETNLSNKYWEEYWKKQGSNIKTYIEDKDALKQLSANNIKLGIVSRSSLKKINEILVANNIRNLFTVIIDRAQKPDTQFLSKAISELNENLHSVLYIGDDQEDIELGKNLGVDTAIILRRDEKSQKSYSQIVDWLNKNKPTFQINNLEELLAIVIQN